MRWREGPPHLIITPPYSYFSFLGGSFWGAASGPTSPNPSPSFLVVLVWRVVSLGLLCFSRHKPFVQKFEEGFWLPFLPKPSFLILLCFRVLLFLPFQKFILASLLIYNSPFQRTLLPLSPFSIFLLPCFMAFR